MTPARTLVFCLAMLPLGYGSARGQAGLHVSRTAGPIHLDGRLDEPDWTLTDSITDLRQREPLVGAAPSERTVVRVVRTADALYVGVRAWDDDMRHVRAAQLRRDADLSTDDNIRILIDGYHDHRGALVFGTNPNGAMWDAQLTNLDEVNEDWNGIWQVVVRRDAQGWNAEFRIPWSTLRFRPGDSLAFGFNVRRFIRRANEEDLWQSWGRAEGLYQLMREGTLSGLGNPRRGHGVDIFGYGLTKITEAAHDSAGVGIAPGAFDAKGGLDAKLALTPALTTDVTVNTDFAQVEADRQVINLTRFPLFFPEKREFFLESSGLFAFGTAERAQAFYSRRIGLDTAGLPVPIIAGARSYGRLGPWRLGALAVRTGGDEDATDAAIRVQHDLFDRSFIGLIGTVRAAAGGTQSTGGLDIDLPLVVHGQNLEPHVWVMGTHAPGTSGVPLAWRLSADNPNDLLDNFVSLYRIDAGFDPALGFVRRTGIWETTGHVDFQPRPHALGVRQLDLKIPIPSWDILSDVTGSLARSADWRTAEFEWRPLGGELASGDEFEVNVQRLLDQPADTFDIFRGVTIAPGRYWWWRYEAQYTMAAGRPFSAGALINWGDFYDGRSTDVELSATWRGGGHAIVEAGLTHSTVHLPAGDFTAVQGLGRIEYDMDTRTSLQALVQYTNEDQRVDVNVRFHWIPAIGDDVFVVWTSGYATNMGAGYRFPSTRSLTRPLSGALVAKVVKHVAP